MEHVTKERGRARTRRGTVQKHGRTVQTRAGTMRTRARTVQTHSKGVVARKQSPLTTPRRLTSETPSAPKMEYSDSDAGPSGLLQPIKVPSPLSLIQVGAVKSLATSPKQEPVQLSPEPMVPQPDISHDPILQEIIAECPDYQYVADDDEDWEDTREAIDFVSEANEHVSGATDFVSEASEEQDFTFESPAQLPDSISRHLQLYMEREDDNNDNIFGRLVNRYDFDWSCEPGTFQGWRENFVGPSGPTFTVDPAHRPLDIFMKYFDNGILDLIVSEANQSRRKLMTRQSSTRPGVPQATDRSEIGIFLSILMLQGLCPLSVEADYFRENGYLTLTRFNTLMSFDRFVQLKTMMQFTDSTSDTTAICNEKLRKLGPFLYLLSSRFQKLYLPSRDIAVSETLLQRNGRINFERKLAMKAAEVGIKSYELCETSTGYCWNFAIHTGKATQKQTVRRMDEQRDTAKVKNVVPPTNATAQIVLDLVQPLLNKGHTLVMDSFLSSPLLARHLKANKTDCLGTVRISRAFVPDWLQIMNKPSLQLGEFVVSYCRDQTFIIWRDNETVAFISTIHRSELGGTDKHGRYKFKPQVALDYDRSMAGVYQKDQLLSAFPIERQRSKVWYKKVFRRLLNVSILNAYIVYRTQHPKATQRQFRTELANEMIAAFKAPTLPGPYTAPGDIIRDAVILRVTDNVRRPFVPSNNHYIDRGPSKDKICVFCKQLRTAYYCDQCQLPLCFQHCFREYHQELV